MNRIIFGCFVAAVVAGCSSPVKLDTVPVEDKSGVPTASKDVKPAGMGAGTSAVAQVDVGRSKPVAAIPPASRLVYFDYDSFEIRPEFQTLLESHAKVLKADKAKRVALEGHTDERGGREYNLALGQKRSEAVRRSLTLLGVGESQLEAVSFGKEKPAVQGATEEAWAKNRRVEISYR